MLLDSQTFELVLTPEVALSSVKKDLGSAGYKRIEVEQIRLFYTPFWVFTFDIEGTAQPISGKTSINACSGDVSEFVPALFERPLNKTRKTAENVESEVESTAVDKREVERVAQARVAAQVGVKKDQVSVSAFQKIYVPFYRIWLSAEGNPIKAEVDGCLGATFGLEGIPKKQKTMDEVTKDTLNKLKTPSGWADLTSRTVDAASSALTGKSAPIPGLGQGGVWLILIAILFVLLFLGNPFASQGIVSCRLDPQYFKTDLNLFVYKFESVRPGYASNNTRFVEGACNFTTKSKDTVTVCAQAYVRLDRNDLNTMYSKDLLCPRVSPGTLATVREFRIEWQEEPSEKHSYEFLYKVQT